MGRGCVGGLAARHRSVRRYSGPVDEADLEVILEAARRAPTAWNLMPVSVQVVRDRGLLSRLADAVGGQEHVAEAPVFLVFSVDYAKVVEAARASGVEPGRPGLGHFAAALVDAGIMAGWAALAAEDLGYGVAFIAVYGNPCGVAEALGEPVVGLAVGRPGEEPPVRPRQPPEALVGFDGYGASPAERAGGVAGVYGGRAARLFRYVLAPGGYLDRVGEALWECLERRGYVLAPPGAR